MVLNFMFKQEYESTEQDPLLEDEVHITSVLKDGHFWSHFSSISDLAGLSELHEAMNRHYNKEEKEDLGQYRYRAERLKVTLFI